MRPQLVSHYFIRRLRSRTRSRWCGSLVGFDPDDTRRRIESSPIVSIVGRTVTTRSGSVYLLDGPPRWREMHPGATDESPLNGCEPGDGFYLDGDGVETWPPGVVVPAMGVG